MFFFWIVLLEIVVRVVVVVTCLIESNFVPLGHDLPFDRQLVSYIQFFPLNLQAVMNRDTLVDWSKTPHAHSEFTPGNELFTLSCMCLDHAQ